MTARLPVPHLPLLRISALLVPALLAGCATAPQPRPVRPGERFTVGDLSLEAPEEPGWVAFHHVSEEEDVLVLGRDGKAGPPDRLVTVRTAKGEDPACGRGKLLETLRARAATLVPGYAPAPAAGGDDPVRPVPRLGPDAARLTYRRAEGAEPVPADGPALLEHLWAIPPSGPDRLYLAKVEAAAGAADAASLLERVEWRDQATPRSIPDATTTMAFQLSPGAAMGTLNGRHVVGADAGFEALVQHERRRGRGWLGGLDVRLRIVGGGKELALATSLGFLGGAIHGRWRLYGGLELGALRVDEIGTGRRLLHDMAVGPRVGASLDVLRMKGADVFLAVDGVAATPNLALATATLGVRFNAPR